ncbi:MAG TPA: FkbM family methyltransferase [Phycisphaerae bacterium]|nr:FkbM family methyltransferase [Phycisphaerae bacterium]
MFTRFARAVIPNAWKPTLKKWCGRKAADVDWWNHVLAPDGLFHWEDLVFDLRREPNTLFIRDEILVAGEYDFHTANTCVVLDIGMNIGDTPLYFARMPHVTKVYGFEPMHATYEWAVANFKLNPKYNHKIVPTCAAVSDQSGTTEIEFDYQEGTGGAAVEVVNDAHLSVIQGASYILKPGHSKRKQRINVLEAATLVADILKQHPNEALVVKCDAEGAEWKIIPALLKAGLLDRIEVLMIEYHYRKPTDLLKILNDAGFVCFLRDLKHSKKVEVGNIYASKTRCH